MKKILSTLALSMPLVGISSANITLDVAVTRSFLMTSPKAAVYTGGRTLLQMYDGYFYTWDDCEVDVHTDPVTFATLGGSFTYIDPFTADPFPDCPKGTTAQILSGDVDKDGVFDDRLYWSIAAIQSATYLEAFLPGSVTLAAAPPSKLRRPFSDFLDGSLGLFFDVVSQNIYEYNISNYGYEKDFTNYGDHHQTWVSGVYRFEVPLRLKAPQTGPAVMTITNMVEANGYRKGLKGFGLLNSNWSVNSMEIDPRGIYNMQWEGNTRANTYPSDKVNFGIYDSLGNLVYPTPRGLFTLSSPYATSFRMLPNAFAKGERGVCRMQFQRAIATSTVANDYSSRSFDWNIHFIDSYAGHKDYEYRFIANTAAVTGVKVAGDPKKLIEPYADYDGDGISNIVEFAFSRDDGDDLSATLEHTSYNQITPPLVLPAPLVAPNPANAPVFYDSGLVGVDALPHTSNKRPGVGGSITYSYEVNYDTTKPKSKWTKLKAPAPGQTIVFSDKKAAKAAGVPSVTWTITDVIEAAAIPAEVGPPPVAAVPAVLGTTTIQSSVALPPTIRVRATATVSKGF